MSTARVEIRIQLDVAIPEDATVRHLEALRCLAEVMAVQAEDGLWTLGSPEAETEDGPSEFLAEIMGSRVAAVTVGCRPDDGRA